ncbi:hypothetical protein SGPA1_11373 [Streptomyces misionensis JCM 4497]
MLAHPERTRGRARDERKQRIEAAIREFARAWKARPPRLPKLKVASSLVRADVGGRR